MSCSGCCNNTSAKGSLNDNRQQGNAYSAGMFGAAHGWVGGFNVFQTNNKTLRITHLGFQVGLLFRTVGQKYSQQHETAQFTKCFNSHALWKMHKYLWYHHSKDK